MKFTYQYRTSDNATHSGVVSASDRDSAFEKIRAQGLKPFCVNEAPGLLNKLIGKGKRWIAIASLVVAVAVLTVLLRDTRTTMTKIEQRTDRHQIYGDPSVMDEIVAAGFAHVFAEPGERFLAAYAQPGVVVDVGEGVGSDRLREALDHSIVAKSDDCREVRELKAIVNGMKMELREYLSQGGSVDAYVELLNERQNREAAIYSRIAKELEGESDDAVREEKNARLRSMGLRTVPKPRKGGVQKIENTPLTPKRVM